MVKVSTKGRYGLRVMIELASNFGRGPVGVKVIANNQDISGNYIHNLVNSLKSAGLLRAVRGPGGGIELVRDPSSINVYQVLEALEGPVELVDCVVNESGCDRINTCVTVSVWRQLTSTIKDVLSGITLAGLAEDQRTIHEKSLMFNI